MFSFTHILWDVRKKQLHVYRSVPIYPEVFFNCKRERAFEILNENDASAHVRTSDDRTAVFGCTGSDCLNSTTYSTRFSVAALP